MLVKLKHQRWKAGYPNYSCYSFVVVHIHESTWVNQFNQNIVSNCLNL